jgi:alkylhydroperoxidase family enzyme
MYNPETDLLFPPRSLPALRNLRSSEWQDLVTSVLEAGPDSIEQMAFILMMARMNNCATCNSDSFRAMTGCAMCATQSLKRFHETDDALTSLYQAARGEVEQYLQKKNYPLSR